MQLLSSLYRACHFRSGACHISNSACHFSKTLALALVALFALAACGGSDSGSSDFESAYLQFYNASPNGANVEMREVDEDSFGSAQFGDATPMYSMESGEIV